MYFIIFASVLASILAILFAVGHFTFRFTFLRRPGDVDPYYGLGDGEDEKTVYSRSLIDGMLAVAPTDEIYINSFDGARLYARVYMRNPNAPFEIAFHGYRSTPMRDFSGGGVETLRRGHNLVLVDQRAHGKSDGRVITFGVRERYDVKAWAEHIAAQYPDNDIYLCGISMGAASVLMASDLELPKNVKGIVADCPYSSPREIIIKVARDMHLPARLCYPVLRLYTRLFAHFDIEAASALDSVKKTKLPILLIHGSADTFVPVEMSRRIAEDGDTVTLHIFDGADHGLSYVEDTERYRKITDDFLKET